MLREVPIRHIRMPESSTDIPCGLAFCGRVVIAAFCCGMLLVTSTSGQKLKTSVSLSAATWTVDLRAQGYQDGSGVYSRSLRMWAVDSFDPSQKETELIATFVTRERVEGLQRRDDPQRQLPFKLHAVVMDAGSGKFLRQFAWGMDTRAIWVVPRVDGGFIVLYGESPQLILQLHSSDLTPRSELKIDLPPAEGDHVSELLSSPTGKTLFIRFGNGQITSCVWVSGDPMAARQQDCDIPIDSVISDTDVAAFVPPNGPALDTTSRTPGVFIRTFGGPWRVLCDIRSPNCSGFEFLTDNTLLLSGPSPGTPSRPGTGPPPIFRVVGDDGKTMSWGPRLESSFRTRSYNPELNLLTFPIYDPNEEGNEGGRLAAVAVYNICKGKRTFQVKNPEANGLRNLQNLTISPDGKHLVLEAAGILHCYNLPADQR